MSPGFLRERGNMSAIFGAIDFKGNAISDEVKNIFRDTFSKCVIDRMEEISDREVYMGCGIQYINSESRREKLPLCDVDLFFDADVILDNRSEIGERLGKAYDNLVPDGEILKDAFYTLGKESLNLMRGAYTFVKYDRKTKTVDMVSDAVGNRFFYYLVQDNVLYYSSLMAPLERIIKERKLNKRWAADFLGNDGLSCFETCEDTSIEGIVRIAPSTHLRMVNAEITENELYWDVDSLKRVKSKKTDAEYKKEFIDLYKSCVEDAIRTDEEVAVLLSGGYDSTSVACLAAPMLKEKGKKLYSFTAIPKEGYVNDKGPGTETDESISVKKTAQFLGNLDVSYVSASDKNLWEARKDYMKICEIPYKSTENMLWLLEGHRKAREKGARIILSGAFGNGTVSFDNSYQRFVWLVKHFKFVEFKKEADAFHKVFHASRKRILIQTLKGAIPFLNIEARPGGTYKHSYIDKQFLAESGVKERIDREDAKMRKGYTDPDKYQSSFLTHENFRHYGEFALKHSLYSGVILRDPTRDKRMIEFVKTCPYRLFFSNGYKRRLIREFMFDIMPIGFFSKHPVGVQSADVKFRYVEDEAVIMPQWRKLASECDGRGIIDTEFIKHDLQTEIKDMGYFDVFRLFYTLNLLEYIQNVNL